MYVYDHKYVFPISVICSVTVRVDAQGQLGLVLGLVLSGQTKGWEQGQGYIVVDGYSQRINVSSRGLKVEVQVLELVLDQEVGLNLGLG